MSKMAELSYDIEQLYIEGLDSRAIAAELNCPIELVLGALEAMNVAETPQPRLGALLRERLTKA